jgi:hypothetical protein
MASVQSKLRPRSLAHWSTVAVIDPVSGLLPNRMQMMRIQPACPASLSSVTFVSPSQSPGTKRIQ